VAAVDLLIGRRRVRRELPRRPKQPRPPSGARMRHFRSMRSLVRQMRGVADQELGPVLERLGEEQRADGVRMDESLYQDLSEAMKRMGQRIEAMHKAFEEQALPEVAGAVQRASRLDVARMIGIDVADIAGGIPVEQFMTANRELIRSLTREAAEQTEAMVREGIGVGRRIEQIRDDIAERFNVAESRAELIARTETAKLKSQIDAERVQRVGITHYIWRTVGDVRTRDQHAELEGTRHAYDSPPVASGDEAHNPGQFPNCRCWAEPDTTDIMGAVEA
jgi:SPP1 gp7 family putative phage head morphogenesis protein